MKWVSLHTHSTFSTGDGYGTVWQHVARVKELGMTAVALTEHGNCSSWVQLEKACKTMEIKPIYGLEAYTAPPGQQRKCHMILLAADQDGLHSLNRIVSQSWRDFYRYPTVQWESLVRWNEGIIALSGCADSYLSCVLLGGKYLGDKRMELSDRDIDAGVRYIQRIQEVLGNRFYLEVQRFPGLDRTCALNPALSEISRRTGALLAATADVHYPYPNDNEMQRILHAAHRGGTVETADASWEYGILLTYPQSDAEIVVDLENTGLSKNDAWAAVINTSAISEQCNVELPKASAVKYVEGR